MAENKKTSRYFNTLFQEKNEITDYEYKPPIYGKSNTDISYYEPQASRIANMRNSAGAMSTGVYDFDGSSKIPDIENCVVPIGRKPGMTFEEISQIQTINNNRIKDQAKKIEDFEAEENAAKKAAINQAVEMSKAITAESQSKESEM